MGELKPCSVVSLVAFFLLLHPSSPLLRLREAETVLERVMTQLKEKQDALAEVEAKITALQNQYDRSVAEKEELSRNIQQTADRLQRASKLTSALADEEIRWDLSVKVRCHTHTCKHTHTHTHTHAHNTHTPLFITNTLHIISCVTYHRA